MSLPSFSIVIPSYQRRDTVRNAVRALTHLNYCGGIEVIVVVDGSTDGTAEALEDVTCPFPLQIIRQANAGPAAARNRGAAIATGDVILFLDDDMMCEPDLLTHHANSYSEGADAVRGRIVLEANLAAGFLVEEAAQWAEKVWPRELGRPLRAFDIASGQLSVRRAIFQELGGFDARLTASGNFAEEDADLGVRLLERCRVDYNPAAISHHRYVVTPQMNMERAFKAAKADMLFVRKHPSLAAEFFANRGEKRWTTRLLYRPLGSIPGMAALLPAFAVKLVEPAKPWPRLLNTLASYFFRLARGTAYWSTIYARGGPPTSRRCLILDYHVLMQEEIGPKIGPYATTPEVLAQQIRELVRRGYAFVSARHLLASLRDGVGLPRRAVLLTFDDCYSALLEVAERILSPRGIPALAFAVTNMPSQTNEWDRTPEATPVRLLSADELGRLESLGCEIGSHSRSHAMMPALDDAQLRDELVGSADDLVRMGLPRPAFFAFPYNYRDSRSIAAVEQAGYAAAFGLTGVHADQHSNRFDLPRVPVSSRETGWRFYLCTRWPKLFYRLIARLDRVGL